MRNINIRAMSISTMWTMVLIVFMTILSELNGPFKGFLKGLTGHHWISKGVISLVFFVLIYFLMDKIGSKQDEVRKFYNGVLATTIISYLAILLFYVYEFYA